MYCPVKIGSLEGRVILLDQEVHVCGNIWWLILILLYSLNMFVLLETIKELLQVGTMSYQLIIFFFSFFLSVF
jgi:hypothetical protein